MKITNNSLNRYIPTKFLLIHKQLVHYIGLNFSLISLVLLAREPYYFPFDFYDILKPIEGEILLLLLIK